MSTDVRRRKRNSSRLMLVLTLAVPAILAGLGYQALSSQQRQLEDAQADLSESERMIADIQRLQERPQVAALYEESPSEITERVSQAIQSAQIPPVSLMEVQPQAPIRVDGTQYLLMSTQIEVAGVTMEKIVRFADALEDSSQGMVVGRLMLTEPRQATSRTDLWDAELTLTQTIFSPTIQ